MEILGGAGGSISLGMALRVQSHAHFQYASASCACLKTCVLSFLFLPPLPSCLPAMMDSRLTGMGSQLTLPSTSFLGHGGVLKQQKSNIPPTTLFSKVFQERKLNYT